MAKKPVNGDRVECAGRKGTLVDVHQSIKGAPPSWSVLFHDGPKQATVVQQGRRLSGRALSCDRCGAEDHDAFACPEVVP